MISATYPLVWKIYFAAQPMFQDFHYVLVLCMFTALSFHWKLVFIISVPGKVYFISNFPLYHIWNALEDLSK